MKHVCADFKKALTKLGIPVGKKNRGYTLHSLRSSFKIICIHAGIPREVVDEWQGHAGHRPAASDGYYKLSDEESQRFMREKDPSRTPRPPLAEKEKVSYAYFFATAREHRAQHDCWARFFQLRTCWGLVVADATLDKNWTTGWVGVGDTSQVTVNSAFTTRRSLKRRARDSNSQPVARHHISSVRERHRKAKGVAKIGRRYLPGCLQWRRVHRKRGSSQPLFGRQLHEFSPRLAVPSSDRSHFITGDHKLAIRRKSCRCDQTLMASSKTFPFLAAIGIP